MQISTTKEYNILAESTVVKTCNRSKMKTKFLELKKGMKWGVSGVRNQTNGLKKEILQTDITSPYE